jgi:hypothetical protein
MRRRLYFVLPDVPTAELTTNDLLLARIDESHIRCLGRRGTPLGKLHEANVLQKTDLAHGTQLGLVIGGVCGMLTGAALAFIPVAGQTSLPMAAIPIGLLGGAVFGAWAASLIASSTPNSRLKMFSGDFEQGRILMMVDVPHERVDEIRDLVARRHPEAASRGIEPAIPAFP